MSAPQPLPTWPYPFWIAHRGAGKLAPENTLAAFRLGAQHGYQAFECDVKLSADGVPFLLHDAKLERTTCGQGLAGELTVEMPAMAIGPVEHGGHAQPPGGWTRRRDGEGFGAGGHPRIIRCHSLSHLGSFGPRDRHGHVKRLA